MPDNYKNTDSIHAYLKGEMEEDILMKFEEELAKNPELANEIQWHKDFQEVMLLAEKKNIKKQIRGLIEEEKKEEGSAKTIFFPFKTLWKSNSTYLAIAAVLLLSIALSLLFLPNNQEPIFAKHLETPYFSSPSKTRGSGENDWVKTYQLRNYKEMAAVLTQKEQTSGLDAEQKFYLGLAYLYQNENHISKAVAYLEAAKQENPIFYESTSHWYIALAHLKNQENEVAKKYLKEIVANKSWKHKDAQELLKELED